ncbi:MAG: LysR family transcriptional regulator [Bryobacterales bacterium]|nr:LysR family transcriptional regulator [Bryobacterales bacterium]
MNWDDYDVFCHVIEHRGFSAAARALERPKSSVSAAIVRLESALGARLIERTTRQLRLTEPGEALYRDVGRLFGELREARTAALAQGEVVAGTLRLAGPHEFSTYQLGPVACTMMSRHPQLKVQIDVADDTINPVESGHDIAFTRLDDAVIPLSSLIQRRVVSLELAVFAAPGLLQERGEPIDPEELIGLPLICSPHDLEWTFAAADGTVVSIPALAPRLSTSNTHVRLQAALAGLGVARIPAFFCAAAVRDLQLRRLLSNYICSPLKIYALLPAKRLMPAKVRLFLDALDQHVTRLA